MKTPKPPKAAKSGPKLPQARTAPPSPAPGLMTRSSSLRGRSLSSSTRRS